MFDPAEYTILIVEDERDLQVMVAQHLVDEGYRTAQASTGLDALTHLRTRPVDLMLLDIMMPGFINGLAVLKIVRDTPELAQIPIIMTTALADVQHVKTALELGASYYLTKPYKLREVTARVEGILRERSPRGRVALASRQIRIAQR